MTLSIEVAVATMDLQDPTGLLERLGLADQDVPVLVINQVTCAPKDTPTWKPESDGRLRVLSFPERGLSRSRNRALEYANADLLVLADDDIRYGPDLVQTVSAAFDRHRDAAFCTFQFVDRDTGRPARDYPAQARRHSRWTTPSVSSVEVVLRRSHLGQARFDERFGLGAQYGSGEEAVLLADLLRSGARGYYVPQALCDHPGLGTGHTTWTLDTVREKGALLRRLYPQLWPVVLAAFVAAKHRHRPPNLPLWAFALEFGKGAQLPLDSAEAGRRQTGK